MGKVNTNISLVAEKQKQFTNEIKKVKKRVEQLKASSRITAERGLVHLNHIPPGFFEDEIRAFFKQFGDVTNVRVLRSQRTGKSKGSAFVEFKLAEVAKIAAETMDNYLMFKRRIEAKYVEPSPKTKNLFMVDITEKHFPKKNINSTMREQVNKNMPIEEHNSRIKAKLSKAKQAGLLDCLQVVGYTQETGRKRQMKVKVDKAEPDNTLAESDDELVVNKHLIKKSEKSGIKKRKSLRMIQRKKT